MWDVSDVHNDIKEHLGVVSSSLSRRIRGRHTYQEAWTNANERTSLLSESLPSANASRSAPAATFSGYNVGDPEQQNEGVTSPDVNSEKIDKNSVVT